MPEPEGAIFESTRVAPRRDRTPLLAAAVLVAIGGLAVVGLSDRDALGDGPGASAGRAASSRPGVIGPAGVASPPPSRSAPTPGLAMPTPREQVEVTFAPAPVAGPQMTSGPGLIQLSARRQPNSVFVHGDVDVPGVTWVFVSLQDAGGRVAGWASISVPGAAGPRTDGGPPLRFDVELAAAYVNFPGTLTLQATAYDGSGSTVASSTIPGLRLLFPTDVDAASEGGAVSGGFRPGAHFPMLDASWGDAP